MNDLPTRGDAGLPKVDIAYLMQRSGLIIAWAIVIVVFGVLKPDVFLTRANFSSIFGSQAVLIVLTLALLITLTCGDFDISVAFVCGLSTMMIAVLNVNHGWAIEWAILAALTMGVVAGFINGLVVVQFQIDSLIATLGTGTIITGIVLWICNLNTISGISPGLVKWMLIKRFFDISLEFYYGVVLCVALWIIFEFTVVGRHLLAVGRAPDVARLSGLHVKRLRWSAYVWSGLIGAAAGVLYAGTTGAADPNAFQSFLFPSFAAVFLGATAIVPGRFNPWGSFIAVYFLVTGITGLQILGVGPFIQQIFFGSALVAGVLLSRLAGRGAVEAPRRHVAPGASGGS